MPSPAPTVHVVGFWKRGIAAAIDFLVIIPVALLLTLVIGKIAGIHMPPSNLHLTDVDLWLDLLLRTDPALVMLLSMVTAIAMLYALVFQITQGRTLGMRVMKLKIIDVWGD